MDPTFPYCLILEYMENGTLDKLLSSLRLGPLPDWYIAYLKQFTITTQTYTSFVAAELMEIIQQIVSAMVCKHNAANFKDVHNSHIQLYSCGFSYILNHYSSYVPVNFKCLCYS